MPHPMRTPTKFPVNLGDLDHLSLLVIFANSRATTVDVRDGPPASMLSHKLRWCIVAATLLIHLVAVAGQVCMNAPLVDEPRHLIAGAHHLEHRRFDIYRVNPPLPRAIAALSLAILAPQVDWRSHTSDVHIASETLVALDYIRDFGRQTRPVFILSRALCIPFTLLGALICYTWARSLFGDLGAILSLCCWCFFPLVQGGASVILPDLPAASMAVLACWCYWNWLRKTTRVQLVASALALGGAFLCKTTLMLLPPVYILAFLIRASENEGTHKKLKPTFSGLAVILAIGLCVLNVGYCCEGTFTPLKAYSFKSEFFSGNSDPQELHQASRNHFLADWIQEIPLPFPRPYIEGIDHLKQEYERGMHSYLRGRWQTRGWYYYNLYTLLVKTPLPLLFLTGLSICAFGVSLVNRGWVALLTHTKCLFLFPVLFFTFHSLQTGLSHHLRYLLPIVPFWCIFVASIAPVFDRTRAGRSILTCFVLWLATEGVLCHPHQLGYYNELVGGPANGHWHLLESNTDWGQDLYYLEDWLNNTKTNEPVLIDYYGFASPRDFGLRLGPMIQIENATNDKCVGMSSKGTDFWLCASVGKLHATQHYGYLLDQPPQFRIGYSIFVYKVRVAEMKEALGVASGFGNQSR